MDILTTIAIIVPTILSSTVSLFYGYLRYKELKNHPKDEVWEATTKIICSNGDAGSDADDFADLYQQLKWFKDHDYSTGGNNSLFTAVVEQRKSEASQAAKDSET